MTPATNNVAETLGVRTAKSHWRRALGWLLILLLLAGGGYAALKKWQAPTETPVRYRTQAARRGDLTVTVTATGKLQPTNEVDVGSEVSGIIDTVEVDYNARVKVGQVLARINTDKLKAQVQQSTASLATARAKVQDAQVTAEETAAAYKRVLAARERTKGQLPSQADVDAAKAAWERAKVAVASAQASVTQAEATLAMDQTNLSKAVIKSPVNGVVLARKVEPGQTIAASFNTPTMFVLAEDLTKMELHVNIDEADVGQVKEGQRASFTVDAFPGRRFPGRLTQLRYQSSTTNGVVTYEAVITVDNKEMLLRPGMTATAEIVVQSVTNALLVPNVALRFTPAVRAAAEPAEQTSLIRKLLPGPPRMNRTGVEQEPDPKTQASRVWVLRDNHPVPVMVKTGATNGKLTEILEGQVAAGDPLVIDSERRSK